MRTRLILSALLGGLSCVLVGSAHANGVQKTFWKANMSVAVDAEQKGDFETAETEFLNAVARARRQLGPMYLAASLFELGSMYERHHDHDAAITQLAEAWAIVRNVEGNEVDKDLVRFYLASAYWAVKRYKDEQPLLEQLLARASAHQPSDHHDLAELFRNSEPGMREIGAAELAERLEREVVVLSPEGEAGKQAAPVPPASDASRGSAKALRAAAEGGDVDAQYRLGVLYLGGKDVKVDSNAAVYWLTRAAEAGNFTACHSLGNIYVDGTGLHKNGREAVRWFLRATENGWVDSQLSLGWIYRYGAGIQVDYAESIRWYRAAADQGSAAGQGSVANAYTLGLGVDKSDAEAFKWLKLAAAGGYAQSVRNLAIVYRDGRGTARDPVEAYAWLHALLLVGESPSDMREVKWMRDEVGKQLSKDNRLRAEKLGEERRRGFAAKH